MKLTPHTFTKEPLSQSSSDARYDFLIENHKKAIECMELVQPYQHDQGHFGYVETKNPCGTAACALGWVAVGNWIDGLQYTTEYVLKNRAPHNYDSLSPIINGKHGDTWRTAGCNFFGWTTYERVFSNAYLNKEGVISHLKARLKSLQMHRKDYKPYFRQPQ